MGVAIYRPGGGGGGGGGGNAAYADVAGVANVANLANAVAPGHKVAQAAVADYAIAAETADGTSYADYADLSGRASSLRVPAYWRDLTRDVEPAASAFLPGETLTGTTIQPRVGTATGTFVGDVTRNVEGVAPGGNTAARITRTGTDQRMFFTSHRPAAGGWLNFWTRTTTAFGAHRFLLLGAMGHNLTLASRNDNTLQLQANSISVFQTTVVTDGQWRMWTLQAVPGVGYRAYLDARLVWDGGTTSLTTSLNDYQWGSIGGSADLGGVSGDYDAIEFGPVGQAVDPAWVRSRFLEGYRLRRWA